MAASGVSVNDDVVTAFNEIKIKHMHQYVMFKLTDDLKEIVVDHAEEKGNCDYNDFLSKLPEKDCRYAVYDYHYTLGDAGKREQLVFIVWCPEVAPIKKKMLYASSKDALKKKLLGISAEAQGSEMSDISENEVLEKCKRYK